MKIKLLLIGCLIVCVTLSGCKAQGSNDNKKNIEVNEEEGINNAVEVMEEREQMPVMSEESIQCIEAALGELSKRGKGIAEFLSYIDTGKIIRAEMVDAEIDGYSNILEVEDESNNVYEVVLNKDYFPTNYN